MRHHFAHVHFFLKQRLEYAGLDERRSTAADYFEGLPGGPVVVNASQHLGLQTEALVAGRVVLQARIVLYVFETSGFGAQHSFDDATLIGAAFVGRPSQASEQETREADFDAPALHLRHFDSCSIHRRSQACFGSIDSKRTVLPSASPVDVF